MVRGPAKDIAGRVKALDWERVSKDLDAQGYTMIEGLITRQECDALAKLYPFALLGRVQRVYRLPGQTQRFLAVHNQVHNLFRFGRHLLKACHYRMFRSRAFSTWTQVARAC